jgi:hypothetical protein
MAGGLAASIIAFAVGAVLDFALTVSPTSTDSTCKRSASF